MRKKLSNTEESHGSNPEDVRLHPSGHDVGHLPVLVPVDVDSPVDRQCRQLIVLLPLGGVVFTEHRLVLVEGASLLHSAVEVEDVSAPCLEALDGGVVLLADHAVAVDVVLKCRLAVDESSGHGLVHLLAPEGAVEMNPLVHLVVEKSSRPVRCCVSSHVAEEAGPCVFLPSRRHHRDSHLEHHLRQVLLVHDLLPSLDTEGAVVRLVVSSLELWSLGLLLLWCLARNLLLLLFVLEFFKLLEICDFLWSFASSFLDRKVEVARFVAEEDIFTRLFLLIL